MIKKIKLLLSSLLITCFTHTALAQSTTTDDIVAGNTSPLTASVISDCSDFLNALVVLNFSSLSPQQQSKALSAAASSTSSLLICYQNNACQQPPLSANPNCSQYLSLWYLSSIAPKPS